MPLSEEYNIQENILTKSYVVRSYEVSATGYLSVPSVFNFLQDAASSHALNLGVSISQLQAENYTWMLSRLLLNMNRYPNWRDAIHVRTWPSGIERVFAMRDFEILQNGKLIGSCISAWIIIDALNRRPVRPKVFADQLNPVDREHVLNHSMGKLPALKNPDYEKSFTVRYKDLDINQHANNVSYIDWMLESMPDPMGNEALLSELEINFLGEAFWGDRVQARCQRLIEAKGQFAHSIVHQSDGRELIRARTAWA